MIPSDPVSPKSILCIDDDEAILSYEKALLERSGYSASQQHPQEEGLDL